MTTLLGFKTELKINNVQRTLLSQHAGTSRHAYNWGLGLTKAILAHNRSNPEERIKFPTAIDLHKWLVAMVKPTNPWYYQVSKCAPQYALRALRQAGDRCFQKKGGVPRFKKKGKDDSFTLDGSFKIESRRIKVPVIGWLKTYETIPAGFVPKSVTISRHADRCLISFKIDVNPQPTPKTVEVVGVDLGVKSLATLSTGEVFEGSKSYRKYEAKLSRLQWINRHRVKGSANYKKAQLKIARLHRKIANIRQDTLHKITTYLAKNHGEIVIEDLNVSGMMANPKLAKAIQDMGFCQRDPGLKSRGFLWLHEFRRQLTYKGELYGSIVTVVDRWFPSSKTCSNCGQKKDSLPLGERVFRCDCGISIDRDLNASLNLALVGSSLVSACRVDRADSAMMKQEADSQP